MQLREDKTYRTRDGLRTGIRVKRIIDNKHYVFATADESSWKHRKNDQNFWCKDGRSNLTCEGPIDLIEEEPTAAGSFSYAACPVGPDGRRRAVTRDGREVVLFAEGLPRELSIVGMIVGDDKGLWAWAPDGTRPDGRDKSLYLFIPPPPKREVWVLLYANMMGAEYFNTEQEAEDAWNKRKLAQGALQRLGNRAHRIEIDAETAIPMELTA